MSSAGAHVKDMLRVRAVRRYRVLVLLSGLVRGNPNSAEAVASCPTIKNHVQTIFIPIKVIHVHGQSQVELSTGG